MTHEANRILEQVLEDKLERHRKASEWVHQGAELEVTGEVLLGELVSGDLRTIERCLDWLRRCESALPATLVPGGQLDQWTLHLDANGVQALNDKDQGYLHAMNHLVFEGPEPRSDCAVWMDLSSIGLPPGLREDLEQP